ncbi:hypothetical protein CLAFUW4_12213 [Fulvia fulva]|uniref:Uncharacterized protein n=1 Tax=Passalora fulva TaxID=5499 RepID=A0A9Q8PEB1_PASFU|nr:uncharacterized protein CLAFUR5_11244 [Fulvia fulva]KAK4617980.1 hypothetical protein CLAFUR4_12218 [Fulvia fulva]KAK4618536.1 hypothetical protein CLAFUR0_12229 [Fulvia fulva]UJO20855.1 hypothetical protein CLAFUR5_11244 [Fulvia fulva]WPV17884.1 hypothetical protein CLAFUW4_12213 [Fulvia fulva]WPV33286.1 hypothetical protein CLAFUW7_12220 [Fulvia fulva]
MHQKSQQQSRLLSLPRELRNRIYTLTFCSHVATVCELGVVRHGGSIIGTCQLARAEATPLYYKHITFLVHDFGALRYWLGGLDEGRRKAVSGILWVAPRVSYGPMPSVLNLREELEGWELRLGKGVLESTELGILGEGYRADEEEGEA